MPIGRTSRRLDVERLGVEDERQRLARRPARQQVRRVAVEQVGEEGDAAAALLVARREVGHPRVARDVERPDAAVDDALRCRRRRR